MNIEQLEAERSRCNSLLLRLNRLQEMAKTLAKDEENVINVAHQALGSVNSDLALTVVSAMVSALMDLEAKDLAAAGVEFPWHTHFPGVTFNGFRVRDREEGSPISSLDFTPGADGAVVRAIEQVKGVCGLWAVGSGGKLTLTVTDDERQYRAKPL
jgi:hypothetical protein